MAVYFRFDDSLDKKTYNAYYISTYEKFEDTKIKLYSTNGYTYIVEFADQDTRDNAYNKFEEDFTALIKVE